MNYLLSIAISVYQAHNRRQTRTASHQNQLIILREQNKCHSDSIKRVKVM